MHVTGFVQLCFVHKINIKDSEETCLRNVQLAELCWYATRVGVNARNAFGMHGTQLHGKQLSYKCG